MIQVQGLKFSYTVDSSNSFMLNIPGWDIAEKTSLALTGPSGSGKTTLLHLISGICIPDEGRVTIDGFNISKTDEKKRRAFRLQQMGLIFQGFELMEHLKNLENILLPLRLSGQSVTSEIQERAKSLAEACGVADKLKTYPKQLSQGERQRIALCRALISKPKYILADEPTGNLDEVNKKHIVDILIRYIEEANASLVMVTHDTSLLKSFDQVISISELTEAEGVKNA